MMNIFKVLETTKSITNQVPKCIRIRASKRSFLHSSSHPTIKVTSNEQEVIIALGSNVGDRLNNFNQALHLMSISGINITKHSCLYETAPAYVTDQPKFLNSAIRGKTKLGPHDLLHSLKKIEKDMGRTKGIRYGPRPIDLDILFYGRFRVNSEILTVPHERIYERPFVLAPLLDLLGKEIENDTVVSWHSLSGFKGGLFEAWDKLGGEYLIGKNGMRRVLPIGDRLWDYSCKTSIMGILNLTPDSFSDGGKYIFVKDAVSHARKLISDGADIIDLGPQSTRPNATRVSPEEELERLIPILEAVKDVTEENGKFLSVDTFYSEVASEAVKKGAHIVNDVSGGSLDPEMFNIVGELNVPYILMHMRGNPTTMQNTENLTYNDVCKEVASELNSRVLSAESSGIPSWRVIIDPGIGFSKNTSQNLEILMGLRRIREEIGKRSLGLANGPVLIGPSRKKFLGEVCGRSVALERDPASVAAVVGGVLGGADIVRVHNVRDCCDAVKLCDAMLGKTGSLT